MVVEIIDLERVLEGDILHIDEINDYRIGLSEGIIEVKPSHVEKIINSFLSKKITASELTKWADFIFGRIEYCSVHIDNEDDDTTDYYEDIWYVIQKLSTPYLDGEITEKLVKEYLKELEKYKNN